MSTYDRSTMPRGQISAEFVIILSLLFILFAGVYSAYTYKSTQFENERISLLAKQTAVDVASAITRVSKMGPGSSVHLVLSPTVDSHPYTLMVSQSGHLVIVNTSVIWQDAPYIGRVNFSTLQPRALTFTNLNGTVVIS